MKHAVALSLADAFLGAYSELAIKNGLFRQYIIPNTMKKYIPTAAVNEQ